MGNVVTMAHLVHVDKPADLLFSSRSVALEAVKAQLLVNLVPRLDLLELLGRCRAIVLTSGSWPVDTVRDTTTTSSSSTPAASTGWSTSASRKAGIAATTSSGWTSSFRCKRHGG